ncbi:MAG: helix-turn-helix transcriptional regulator [Humidesulfovibrio sp.]|nr:helix-turn-helix transcriptional regulator [Humidesulfovibrio sp.]
MAPFITEETSAMPWREAAGVSEAELPGRAVRGGRVKEGLTQAELAALVGIPQRHVSEMEHGKRPIGREMAKRLGAALKVSYKVFL